MGQTGLLVAVVVLIAAAIFGLVRRGRDGKVRPVPAAPFDLSSLGVEPGRVTLLQFSSAFCAPCRATRAVLARIASETPSVEHLQVDAESHLEAVRALGIWRTPTVLIIDASGRLVGRAQGTPTLAQIRAAIGVLHA